MKVLHKDLLAAIAPRINSISENAPAGAILYAHSFTLRAWCNILSFGRWLHLDSFAPLLGKLLMTKIVSMVNTPSASADIELQLAELCTGTLAILLEECHLCSQRDRLPHLDLVVAAYVSFCRIRRFSGEWRSFSFIYTKSNS